MSTEGSQATAAASAMSQKYHSMFPQVVPLTSQTLINDTISKATEDTPQWNIDGQHVLLVDVRSQPERKVSMISGAISLNEFKTKVLPNLIDKASDDAPSNIVLYCTIGYRSGMEGQKLMNEYPYLFREYDDSGQSETNNNLSDEQRCKMRIRNMDGIVPFANALESANMFTVQSNLETSNFLIDPSTKQSTNRVHVYGSSWKHCLNERYDPVTFSRVEFAWRGLGVLFRSITCPVCSSLSCCCRPNKKANRQQ